MIDNSCYILNSTENMQKFERFGGGMVQFVCVMVAIVILAFLIGIVGGYQSGFTSGIQKAFEMLKKVMSDHGETDD